jgi:hypothetical protein
MWLKKETDSFNAQFMPYFVPLNDFVLVHFKTIRVHKPHTQSNQTHVYLNLIGYIYMHATCFSPYLGHSQSCQYTPNSPQVNIPPPTP